MVEGAEIENTAWESISVQKENGQSVVARFANSAIAAWLPVTENGLTVMKFSWYWICRAATSNTPFNGVVVL